MALFFQPTKEEENFFDKLKKGFTRVKKTPIEEFFLPTSKKFRRNLVGTGNILEQIGERVKPKFEENEKVAQELEKKGFFGKQMAADVRLKKGVSEAVLSLPGEIVKGKGRLFRRMGEGEKPDVSDYLELIDFIPGLGIVGGGIKAVGKSAGKNL